MIQKSFPCQWWRGEDGRRKALGTRLVKPACAVRNEDSGYENDAHSKNWRNPLIAHARVMMIKLVQVLVNKQKYSMI